MIERKIEIRNINSLYELINYISRIDLNNSLKDKTVLAFRGEKRDYSIKKENDNCFKNTELAPFIYRKNYSEHEDTIFRESQRFNNQEFIEDRTAFDKLSRIQHYSAPTRLLDISEDLMSALYFATEGKKDKEESLIYIFEIEEDKIKYYDSDTVSVISNLAKIPLDSKKKSKSKRMLLCDSIRLKGNIKEFNKTSSAKFLRHEIREEKPQFESIINPKHLTSIQCVRPKLTSGRIKSQKGFFLLFGLNEDNHKEHIKLIDDGKLLDTKKVKHPIKKIHKITISNIKNDLEKIGIKKPFIYPEIDKVSEYLTERYK